MTELDASTRIAKELSMNPSTVERKLTSFVKKKVENAGATGAVVGLSGGIDSSVVVSICAKALGGNRVIGVSMPEGDLTDPHDVADARDVANKFGVTFKVVDIAPALLGIRQNLAEYNAAAQLPAANMRPRVRMVILYYYANLFNKLVIGCGNRSELRAGYFCYDTQTRAFTTEGLKDYTQLKTGDIIFTLNLKTGKVEEKPVAGVYSFNYDGDMLHFVGKRTDLMVTPNHRMIVCGRDGSFIFKTAGELYKQRVSLPIPAPWEGKISPPSFIDINKFYDQNYLPWQAKRIEPFPTREFLYLLGLFIGDGTAYHGRVKVPVKTDFGQRYFVEFYRDEKGRFISAQGSKKWREYDTYETFFAIPVNDRARQPLEEILSRHKIRYSTTQNVVRIHSRALYETFSACSHGARQKHIPRWVLQYPAEELEYLFKGLMDSDGHKEKGSYYTSSYQLALDLIEVCVKTGRHATIRTKPPKERIYGDKKIRSNTSYEITFPRKITSTSLYPDNTKKVHYKGIVWCPDIPETHNLLVERNCKFAFCGNTKYGDGGADLHLVGCLYKTQVRQLASHLGLPKHVINKVSSAGLWRGQTDEGELGISYEKLDMIYAGLDIGLKPAAIAKAVGVDLKKVRYFIKRERNVAHKLTMPEVPKL